MPRVGHSIEVAPVESDTPSAVGDALPSALESQAQPVDRHAAEMLSAEPTTSESSPAVTQTNGNFRPADGLSHNHRPIGDRLLAVIQRLERKRKPAGDQD